MAECNLSSPPPPPVEMVWRGGFVGGYLLAAKIISLIEGDCDREAIFTEYVERSGQQSMPSSVTAGGDVLYILAKISIWRCIGI